MADHNKYIQHKHIHYAIKELHKNEKIKKELGKEQSKSQEGFKEFVDCSKTVYKKPRHAVCFNPKSKQHRPPPSPIWLNRKVREIPTPNLRASARNTRLNTTSIVSNGGFGPG